MFNKLLPPIYRQLRLRAKLSQAQLAVHLKCHRSTVNKWETGKARPDPEQERELLKLADCSQEELAEMVCEQMSEVIGKAVRIVEGGESYQPFSALAKARALRRKADGRVPQAMLRAFNNKIHTTQFLGLVFERSKADMEELGRDCLREVEKEDSG